MKILIVSIFSISAIVALAGMAKAGIFTDIIAHFNTSFSMDSGSIPWPAFIILLATGIIGILGIRSKG
ncbi:MAG: hypothetical protein JRE18_11660 [Deltaproteobacteria bacterium]|jgi:hypothetical protein|nr:hypothetical protein [Deltaproteobacteria bacterium]